MADNDSIKSAKEFYLEQDAQTQGFFSKRIYSL